jgi:hypothetical protein
MTTVRPIASGFQQGEAVVLARGTYQGKQGIFLHLNADQNWADIQENDGSICSHPVAWLEHSAKPVAL